MFKANVWTRDTILHACQLETDVNWLTHVNINWLFSIYIPDNFFLH